MARVAAETFFCTSRQVSLKTRMRQNYAARIAAPRPLDWSLS
jgi:hypothetical protein